jgi:hypothetical protein
VASDEHALYPMLPEASAQPLPELGLHVSHPLASPGLTLLEDQLYEGAKTPRTFLGFFRCPAVEEKAMIDLAEMPASPCG